MNENDIKKIIEHQVAISLQERKLSIADIGTKQYKDELYEMAVKLLVELNNGN